MAKKVVELLADIEEKGYIGAGPMRLTEDPNWHALKETISRAYEVSLSPDVKISSAAKKPVAPKVVALPVHKSGKK